MEGKDQFTLYRERKAKFKTPEEADFIHKEALKHMREFKDQMPSHLIIPLDNRLKPSQKICLGLLNANLRSASVQSLAMNDNRTAAVRILSALVREGYAFNVGKGLYYETDKWTEEDAKEHAKTYYRDSRNIKGSIVRRRTSIFDAPAAAFVEVMRKDEKWKHSEPLPNQIPIDMGKRGIIPPSEQKDSASKGDKLWHELLR